VSLPAPAMSFSFGFCVDEEGAPAEHASVVQTSPLQDPCNTSAKELFLSELVRRLQANVAHLYTGEIVLLTRSHYSNQ